MARGRLSGFYGPGAKDQREPLTWDFTLERVTGIEPALSAWEADVLPLNYTRADLQHCAVRRAGLCSPRHRTGTGRLPGCSSPIVTSGPRSSLGG